jgi:hypothetical protein
LESGEYWRWKGFFGEGIYWRGELSRDGCLLERFTGEWEILKRGKVFLERGIYFARGFIGEKITRLHSG